MCHTVPFAPHVLINIVGFNLLHQTVCVSIDEPTLGAVLPLEIIVMKIVHHYFTVVENRHPATNRLVEFCTLLVHSETSRIVGKQCITGKQMTGN